MKYIFSNPFINLQFGILEVEKEKMITLSKCGMSVSNEHFVNIIRKCQDFLIEFDYRLQKSYCHNSFLEEKIVSNEAINKNSEEQNNSKKCVNCKFSRRYLDGSFECLHIMNIKMVDCDEPCLMVEEDFFCKNFKKHIGVNK